MADPNVNVVMAIPQKNLWESKTFWTNLVLALAQIIPFVREFVSSHPAIFTSGFAVVNIALRLITSGRIVLGD